MEAAHGAATTLDDKVKLDPAEEEGEGEGEIDPKLYQAIVGSLMYIALVTRPDIPFAVAELSRYNSRPFARHLTAAQRVLRYLKVRKDYRLCYNSSITGPSTLIGYTDSEWASNSADRKSHGAHIFISNGTICWQSRTQDSVATSTLEAEYIACSEASREAGCVRQLCKDTKREDDDDDENNEPLPILCDIESAVAQIIHGIIKARTKHRDICYHNSRDLHERGIVKYSWVSTQENVADIFTKALPRENHEKFTKAMSLW